MWVLYFLPAVKIMKMGGGSGLPGTTFRSEILGITNTIRVGSEIMLLRILLRITNLPQESSLPSSSGVNAK